MTISKLQTENTKIPTPNSDVHNMPETAQMTRRVMSVMCTNRIELF